MADALATYHLSFFYLQDHLGSPIRLMGAEGGDAPSPLGEALAYDEFGVPLAGAGSPAGNPFDFTGYQSDKVSGLYYAQARYYQPTMGRFVAEDGARDGLNWYGYCRANPLRYWDPSGHTGEDIFYKEYEKYRDTSYDPYKNLSPGHFGVGLAHEGLQYNRKNGSTSFVVNGFCAEGELQPKGPNWENGEFLLGSVIADGKVLVAGLGGSNTVHSDECFVSSTQTLGLDIVTAEAHAAAGLGTDFTGVQVGGYASFYVLNGSISFAVGDFEIELDASGFAGGVGASYEAAFKDGKFKWGGGVAWGYGGEVSISIGKAD